MILVGFFGGQAAALLLGQQTLTDTLKLVEWFVFFVVVGFLIPLRYYQRWLKISKIEATLFLMVGVGPLLFSLFLGANKFITTETKQYKCAITKAYVDPKSTLASSAFTIETDCGELSEYPSLFQFEMESYAEKIPKATSVRYELQKGIMGYWTVHQRELVP